jgi:uncharacterized protein YecE (DUF72 family)
VAQTARRQLKPTVCASAPGLLQALALAEGSDRIHLRTTHHAYAQHLEQLDDWQSAIQQYEKSGAHLQVGLMGCTGWQ